MPVIDRGETTILAVRDAHEAGARTPGVFHNGHPCSEHPVKADEADHAGEPGHHFQWSAS